MKNTFLYICLFHKQMMEKLKCVFLIYIFPFPYKLHSMYCSPYASVILFLYIKVQCYQVQVLRFIDIEKFSFNTDKIMF